jgi:hypothetical protein
MGQQMVALLLDGSLGLIPLLRLLAGLAVSGAIRNFK